MNEQEFKENYKCMQMKISYPKLQGDIDIELPLFRRRVENTLEKANKMFGELQHVLLIDITENNTNVAVVVMKHIEDENVEHFMKILGGEVMVEAARSNGRDELSTTELIQIMSAMQNAEEEKEQK